MVYVGSKSRIAESICNVILRLMNKGDKRSLVDHSNWSYFEPFCGGCGVSEELVGYKLNLNSMVLSDLNPYVISLLEYAYDKNNDMISYDPPSKEEWSASKLKSGILVNDSLSLKEKAMIGAHGLFCGFKGIFFGGYYPLDKKSGRNLYKERLNSFYSTVNKLRSSVSDLSFESCRYFMMSSKILEMKSRGDVIVYCDPPYENECSDFYSEKWGAMSHRDFWIWATDLSKRGVYVLVSETSIHSGFEDEWECVGEYPITYSIGKRENSFKIDRLFLYKSLSHSVKLKSRFEFNL